ncbi:MAG TPA: response regulator [Pilimelia sp.]|nr:response regulator [Pilimelia sp.]
MKAIRLLLVEDDEDDAALVVRRLRREGFEVSYDRVDNAATMAEALQRQPPDLVISDNRMPTFDAQSALRLVRDSGLDVPFIVVSGQIGEEAAAALMRTGAHDFVLKDSLTRLVPVVERELGEARRRDERRRALAALHTSEERFRLVAEHLKDIVFRYRLLPEPAVEYISPAASALTGHTPEELRADVGLLFAIVEPEDRPAMERSWHCPPDRPLVLRVRRPDGERVWLEQRAIGIQDRHGALVAVEGILRDVTERIVAEQERQTLEHQLRQAERLDSLGQLAGGIAHDFNNLLGVISGYAGLALDSLPPGDPIRADLEGIAQAAEQAARLTRQLLIFSRLQPSQPELIDLNAVVADTERLLRRTIGEDIEFVTETEPGVGYVRIDRGRLEQIILNLVVNARTAMPDGGRLTIATATAEDSEAPWRDGDLAPGRYVRLTVSDTGCGMEPDVARRAFEPFFTTKGPGSGSGLGLATVYGAVKEAAGAVRLWSEPGTGTAVTLYLPGAGGPEQPVTPAEPDSARARGEHVLVVEDDDAVRDIACRILTQAGYAVTSVARRDAALRLLGDPERRLDLVLSDVVMPGMSAAEFIDTAGSLRPALPIVLMSGYPDGAVRDGRQLPAQIPLVPKPFDASTLLRAVRAALRRVHR